MKRTLRILALLLVIGAVFVWLATGTRRGWTSTEDTVKQLDEVTGIEGVTQVKKFRAGVDFLGAAFLSAGVLSGISFMFRTNQTNNHR